MFLWPDNIVATITFMGQNSITNYIFGKSTVAANNIIYTLRDLNSGTVVLETCKLSYL